MLNALVSSAAENSPKTPLEVLRIADSDKDILRLGKCSNYLQNTRKTRHHCALVQAAEVGELLCLIDCDMLVLRDLSDAESFVEGIDLAYTIVPGGLTYINTGVVFVRVSERTKSFYREWSEIALRMLKDRVLHDKWKRTYGGINQCALALRLSEPNELTTLELDGKFWNATTLNWPTALECARMVHILGKLRSGLLNRNSDSLNDPLLELKKKWRRYESCNSGVLL